MSKAKDFLSITSGAFLLALGTVHFAEEASIVSGGASGLAVAVAGVGHWFGIEIPLYLTTALLNIPLFVFGYKKQGKLFTF
ncbi:MAG: YitT family protein, partial [Clostridia bacterium]|nr:YitT family protein [Clostridia bacterium]